MENNDGSNDVDAVRTRSGSDDVDAIRTRSGSDDVDAIRTRSGSDDVDAIRTRSGSDDVDAVRTRSGSDDSDAIRTRSGSDDVDAIRTRSGSDDIESASIGVVNPEHVVTVRNRRPGDRSPEDPCSASEEEAAREQMVAHFQEVTGLRETSTCRDVLAASGWDLDAAVRDVIHLADSDSESPLPPPVARPWLLGGWLSRLLAVARGPLLLLVSAVSEVLRLCYSILQGGRAARPALSPPDDVARFIAEYEREYGAAHPAFFRGSYREAVAAARERPCFLLVYLHSWRHQDTPLFCRHVFSDQQLVSLCDGELLVWACSVELSEGQQVAVTLQTINYPFLGVVGPRAQSRMSLVDHVDSVECLRAAPLLLERLRRIMADNARWMAAARVGRDELRQNQQLRRQQDADYLASLRADQEKERLRGEQEAQERLAEQQRLRGLQQLHEERGRCAALVPESPSEQDCALHVDRITRLQIKLPSGARIERRFWRDCSLSAIYYLVFCHEEAPARFQIVRNYPHCVLACEPSEEPGSLADAGLGRAEVLYVRDLDA